MIREHANISLLNRLDQCLDDDNIAEAAKLFTKNFVWHFFNPQLPDIQGDYVGFDGWQTFLGKLAIVTGGTFQVETISCTPMGDELVVTHVQDTMQLGGQPMKLDAVVVWRIVNGCIAEAWDIPAIHTVHTPRPRVAKAA
ncbi:MAG: nuclear transport factor 2 family protein [Cyanobacteria bacterium P01_D01_bin.2]